MAGTIMMQGSGGASSLAGPPLWMEDTRCLQLLRDNLTLWAEDAQEEKGDTKDLIKECFKGNPPELARKQWLVRFV